MKQKAVRITISGTPGSGKSTVARYIAKQLKVKFFSVGEMARKIAVKKGISVDKLSEMAVKDSRIDYEIDKVHKTIKGNFVLDSRIAFEFFPDSFSIFLYCKPRVAAQRIWKDKRKTETFNLKQTEKEVERRAKLDIIRYKKHYGIDISDFENYDVVIDTSEMDEKQVEKTVFDAVKKLYL